MLYFNFNAASNGQNTQYNRHYHRLLFTGDSSHFCGCCISISITEGNEEIAQLRKIFRKAYCTNYYNVLLTYHHLVCCFRFL